MGRSGNHLARFLAFRGIRPILHYLSAEADARRTLEELHPAGIASYAVQGDLSKTADVERIYAEISSRRDPPSMLVHTVGSYTGNVRSSNLDSAVLVCERFLPMIEASGRGRILLFGAAGINRNPEPGEGDSQYMRAKKELLRYCRDLARRSCGRNTTVNMISPGEMEYSIRPFSSLPMGRRVRPEELCHACLFLLGPEAESITGQNLEISGGFNL